MPHRPLASFFALLLLATAGHSVYAFPPFEDKAPSPPLRWTEMQRWPTIVVATATDLPAGVNTYTTREPAIALKIQRVLFNSGNRVSLEVGATIAVTLKGRYTVETRPIPPPYSLDSSPLTKDDGIPRLCYLESMNSLGSLSPRVLLADARKAALYFLTWDSPRPSQGSFCLEKMGQVEPAEDADAWAAIHDGKMQGTLLFRLRQTIDPQVRREAQEELYQTRDPEIIKALAPRIVENDLYDEGAAEALMAIGDRNGDVYDALRPFFHPPSLPAQGTVLTPYRPQFMLLQTMASVNPDRAVKDFTPYLHSPEKDLRCAMILAFVKARTPAALDHLIDLANDPEVGFYSVRALYECLQPEPSLSYYSPIDRDEEKRIIAHLTRLLRPRFPELLRSRGLNPPQNEVDSRYLQEMRSLFSRQPNASPPLADKPDRIPGLVRSLRSTGLKNIRPLYTTLMWYALICPNTLRREMQAQGVDERFAQQLKKEARQHETELDDGGFFEIRKRLGYIAADDEIYASRLPDHFQTSREYIAEAARSARESAAQILKSHSYDLTRLPPCKIAFLLACDPGEGKAIFEPLFTHRADFPAGQRAELLALAIHQGQAGYTSELISAVLSADAEEQHRTAPEKDYLLPGYPKLLLTDDTPEALHAYLELTDARRHLSYNFSYSGTIPFVANYQEMGRSYEYLVAALFPQYADAFFARALFLLESPELAERQAGVRLLKNTIHTSFGFRAGDFASIRQKKLSVVRAAIRQISGRSAIAVRQTILQREGITLWGTPGPGWLPKLAKAIHENPDNDAISGNALILIEALTSARYPIPSDPYDRNMSNLYTALSKLPADERNRAVAARIQDFTAVKPK